MPYSLIFRTKTDILYYSYMVNHEIESIARRLRYEATIHLRKEPNIGEALRFFSLNEAGFAQRVGEFEDVCGVLNSLLLEEEDIDPSLYKNVAELKGMLGSSGAPRTLSESIYICEELRKEGEYVETSNTANAFDAMKEKIASGEWGFVRETSDDRTKLASALLIEGYGVYTEKVMDFPEESGLARKLVLAFEEILIEDYPNSALLKDVVGWMKEEKADFGEGTQSRLENI